MLLTDEPRTKPRIDLDRTTTRIDPELLIEEARQLQQRRRRRRTTALVATAILAVLGIGVTQIVRGHTASGQQPGVVLAVARQQSGVVYEKVETVIETPHVPTVRRTGEIWFSTAAPWAYRELLTIPGKPTFEVGAERHRAPKFGREQLVYLYDAAANTIYQTGAYLVGPPQPSPRSVFRRFLAQPGVVLVGTRLFERHRVYVARVYGSTSIGNTSYTIYVDATSYQPLLSVLTGPDLRWTTRILVDKTLPATTATLKLTSLTRSHPGARARPAPPSIDALYGEANQIGSFGGSDLGPMGG